jgi:hypothetical protein
MPSKVQAKGKKYESSGEYRERNGLVQVNAQMDEELRTKLRVMAAKRNLTISDMIADLIRDAKDDLGE